MNTQVQKASLLTQVSTFIAGTVISVYGLVLVAYTVVGF